MDIMDIYRACQVGNLERLEEIISKAREQTKNEQLNNSLEILSQPDSEGIYPLHWAALNGRWLVCKYILDQGVQVDRLGGDQEAPALHWAICKGHCAVVALLFRFGADWRIIDRQGYNAMHVAAQNGQEMIILYLKAHGANINSPDRAGRSPLLWAAYRGHGALVEILIKNGANLDQMDESGRGPLHWAVIKGQAVCAAKLLKSGASLNIRDIEGKLPGDWAREKEISWFDKLNKITTEYRKSRASKPHGRTFELIGTTLIPCLITPTLIISFVLCSTWWWSILIGSMGVFLLYNLSAQILIPPEVALPATSFLAFYNYSTLTILIGICFLFVLPRQIFIQPFMGVSCATLAIIAAWALFKLKFADSGKLELPRSDFVKNETIFQLATDGILDKRHFCVTCSIHKPLRSKHCKTCDRCVGRFDHHCPWINNCVGFHNHRTFMVYLYSCIGLSMTFIPLTWNYLKSIGLHSQTIPRSSSCFLLSDEMCRAASRAPVVFWVFCFGIFMTFWLIILTATQTFQILKNLTTNELSNYARLEYFYPQLKPEDAFVPFEKISNEEKSLRYFNVFDRGIIFNWIDFWKHPLKRKNNFNSLWLISEDDLRHARMRLQKKKFNTENHTHTHKHNRSISASSIPIIKNLINNFKPKRDCCSGHGCDNKSKLKSSKFSSTLMQANSKQALLDGINIV